MGLFKKVKEGLDNSAAAAQFGGQVNAQNQQYAAMQQQGMVGVQGAQGMMDPAAMGGPSTRPLDPNDPLFQPINGVSLELYADVAKACQAAGVTDEAGMGQIAESQFNIPAADMATAVAGWTQRMQQSMVIGQQFNKLFMGR